MLSDLPNLSNLPNLPNLSKITFIIPTIGRETLQYSINSLLNQTIKIWSAIIIFDGVKINIKNDDERINLIEIEKMGLNINSAGLVRNYGMSLVKSDWIAFLDDDDIISNNYIEIFYNELKKYSEIDLLIFRMNYLDRIIPKIDADNFYLCDVGISFIMNRRIYDNNILFVPDGAEDFLYLDKIRKNGYKIMISQYTTYFVRTNIIKNNLPLGKEIFINFDINNKIFIGYLFLYNLLK
jgi:glycosyltransferase involved in cell wall biosynthesis